MSVMESIERRTASRLSERTSVPLIRAITLSPLRAPKSLILSETDAAGLITPPSHSGYTCMNVPCSSIVTIASKVIFFPMWASAAFYNLANRI